MNPTQPLNDDEFDEIDNFLISGQQPENTMCVLPLRLWQKNQEVLRRSISFARNTQHHRLFAL